MLHKGGRGTAEIQKVGLPAEIKDLQTDESRRPLTVNDPQYCESKDRLKRIRAEEGDNIHLILQGDMGEEFYKIGELELYGRSLRRVRPEGIKGRCL